MASFFRVERAVVGVAFVVVGVGLLGSLAWLFAQGVEPRKLACSRNTSGVALCSVVTKQGVAREPPRATFEVNAYHRLGGPAGHRNWEIVLYDERGRETLLASIQDAARALALRDAIGAALDDPTRRSFDFALPEDGWSSLVLLVALVPAFFCLRSGFVRLRRVIERPFAPLSPGTTPTIWNVRLDPDSVEPPAEYWKGRRRAVLRKLLFFGGSVVALCFGYELLRVGYDSLRSRARERESRTSGWLELSADHRCQFEGIWVFPGTTETFTRAPGRYAVSVFDVATPGHWQTQSFDVLRGRATRVTCRPHASAVFTERPER